MEKSKKLDSIKKIMDLTRRNIIENPFFTRGNLGKIYLDAIKDEVGEVMDECKAENKIYLEDELGDIFFAYLMALEAFEKKGYIDSSESVFEHALEKYTERMKILDIENNSREKAGEMWDAIKIKQKEILKERHEKKYHEK